MRLVPAFVITTFVFNCKKTNHAMFFLNEKQSHEWRDKYATSSIRPVTVSNGGEFEHLTFDLPDTGQLLWSVKVFCSLFDNSESCLLLVTQCNLWESRENFHLYYQLKISYADRRLLNDAPGHLFLEYERNELQTFVYLAILFGWNLSIYTQRDTTHAVINYKGQVAAYAKAGWGILTLRDALAHGKIECAIRDCISE